VSQRLGFLEERGELTISDPEVVDPDRGIDEDHAGVVRRLGIALKAGSRQSGEAPSTLTLDHARREVHPSSAAWRSSWASSV
jgi:hypothetical protein